MSSINHSLTLIFTAVTIMFFIFCFFVGLLPKNEFLQWVYPMSVIYISFTALRSLFYFTGAVKDKIHHRALKSYQKITNWPLVTIIIPAFNEEKVIGKALLEIFKFDYPSLEVIVVDDGSTDQTSLIARSYQNLSDRIVIKVFRKPNGGKAAALNFGLARASGKVIMCVDADSKVTLKSIESGIMHFQDPSVGAVAGFVEVSHTDSLLLKFQHLEYLLGLNYIRRAMSTLGIVPIIPGPVGLFRREAIMDVGGFDEDRSLLAEDAELSIRLISYGWKIKSEEDMISITEAPEDIMSLLRQRYRWNRGVFQAFRFNARDLLFNYQLRAHFLFFYMLIEAYFIPIINMGAIILFCTQTFVQAKAELVSLWLVALVLMDLVAISLATYKHGGPFRWIHVMLLSKFSYNFLLLMWRNYSLFEEWGRKKASWDKLSRIGRI